MSFGDNYYHVFFRGIQKPPLKSDEALRLLSRISTVTDGEQRGLTQKNQPLPAPGSKSFLQEVDRRGAETVAPAAAITCLVLDLWCIRPTPRLTLVLLYALLAPYLMVGPIRGLTFSRTILLAFALTAHEHGTAHLPRLAYVTSCRFGLRLRTRILAVQATTRGPLRIELKDGTFATFDDIDHVHVQKVIVLCRWVVNFERVNGICHGTGYL